MNEGEAAVGVELLGSRHDRSSFSCGSEPLDRYLREQAGQDVKRHLATVWVATDGGSAARILGYDTLTGSEVSVAEVPAELGERIPYSRIPCTLLGRLAVDQRCAGRGIGGFLLLDAAARALDPAAPASLAMIVDPLDERASAWYRRFGFIPLAEQSDRLFLPLETLRRALVGL